MSSALTPKTPAVLTTNLKVLPPLLLAHVTSKEDGADTLEGVPVSHRAAKRASAEKALKRQESEERNSVAKKTRRVARQPLWARRGRKTMMRRRPCRRSPLPRCRGLLAGAPRGEQGVGWASGEEETARTSVTTTRSTETPNCAPGGELLRQGAKCRPIETRRHVTRAPKRVSSK